jgi:hypothetical protein
MRQRERGLRCHGVEYGNRQLDQCALMYPLLIIVSDEDPNLNLGGPDLYITEGSEQGSGGGGNEGNFPWAQETYIYF